MLSPLYASDLGVGITGWYAEWVRNSSVDKTTFSPVLYLGPSISFQFADNWSTTLVALRTVQKYQENNKIITLPIPPFFILTDLKLSRYDIDLALNYAINRYLKIYAGAKYLTFEYEEGKHRAIGPGMGVNITIPLFDSFYLLSNISGLYIVGNQTIGSLNQNNKFKEYGINLAAQLAYYSSSLTTTFAGGYRYQYVKTRYNNPNYNVPNINNQFRGLTFLVVKSFEL